MRIQFRSISLHETTNAALRECNLVFLLALIYSCNIICGLHYLYAMVILHMDLKPENHCYDMSERGRP